MYWKTTARHAVLIMSVSLIFNGEPAASTDASRLPHTPSQIVLGKPVVPPYAYAVFCHASGYNCQPVPPADGFEPSERRIAEVRRVNRRVNSDIAYRPDAPATGQVDRWDARVRRGDCEDYALTKREELIDLGWPSRRLLLAMALTEDGVGHVVVIVRLEDSDLVLDNLSNRIVAWHATSHRYLKVQSAADPTRWHATLESVAASPL
jgi:predicted transglutaminase-like cysteine proteinase